MPEFFTESWSLTIEEFSYLLGPALLFVMLALSKLAKRKLFLIITVAIIVLGCYMRYRYHLFSDPVDMKGWSQGLRKVVIYRIDSIYYGFIGAYLANYKISLWQRSQIPLLLIGFLSFFSLHLGIFIFDLNPFENRLFYNIFYLPGLMLSLLCFFPYCSNMLESKNWFAKPITYISIISYAMYLVNYSILLLTMDRLIDITSLGLFGKIMIVLLFWTLTLIFSHLLFKYWEKPFLKLREHPSLLKYFGKIRNLNN